MADSELAGAANGELAGAGVADENPADGPPPAEERARATAVEQEPGSGVVLDAAVADAGVPQNPPPGAAAEVREGGEAEVKGGSAVGEGELKEKAIGELKHEDGGKEGLGEEGAHQSFDFNAQGGGEGYESGSEEEQAAFMRELAAFFRERSMEFKPPKFYGEGLNCLKLWRAVIRLGGYDQVTYCKLWRQVGESFRPPKTCTTVSWTFRGFYEKALLDYERHKVQIGEVTVAASPLSEPPGAKNQISVSKTPNSGRARRDAAARAMQGWHSQRLLGNGEVGDPIIKDKSNSALAKREKQLKNLSPLKRKKSSSVDRAVKVARIKVAHPRDGQIGSPGSRSETTVIDIGPAADWVKINVQRTRDCFEVYALVPGLLREEVRVQSDPAGRLVISGEPEQPDNPWGVTPFKKIVSLPSRIDPNQTSAVVTLHGQLFVRAPFEQSA